MFFIAPDELARVGRKINKQTARELRVLCVLFFFDDPAEPF